MRAWFVRRHKDNRLWSPYGWVDDVSRSYAYRYPSQEDAANAIAEVRKRSPETMQGAGFVELTWQDAAAASAGIKSDYSPFGFSS